MATIAEKFRKIRIAPTFSITRQEWITSIERNGWVWDDSINDWTITVGGVKYIGQELLRVDWYDKQEQWARENPDKALFIAKTGTFELRYDAERNVYYYVNDLGQPIYDYTQGSNAKNDLFVGKTILETPNYNFDELIPDILGKPITPKKPEVGLYDTKAYFDLLTRTRSQYKTYWSSENQTEKITALEERATDIVSEQKRIINILAIEQKSKTVDSAIINTVSLVASVFGGGGGKASGVAVQTAVRYAQSQTTDRRVTLLGEELQYIENEYEAIKTFFAEQNINLTASSGFEKWLVKNWGWIVAATVSFSAMIYFIRKRRKSK